jgi:hypothetical protein
MKTRIPTTAGHERLSLKFAKIPEENINGNEIKRIYN